MITIPGTIPLRIHPSFWLLIFLIGWMNSLSILGTFLWSVVIFLSVLFHEYGHALTAMAFGQKSRIDLVLTGGLTQRSGPPLKLWKEFFVILNGPLAGFMLYGISLFFFQKIHGEQMPLINAMLQMSLYVNLFWTLINLLPIQPLDGGRLLSVILEMLLGLKGIKISLFVSMLLAGVLAVYFFYYNNIFAGSILFLLMYESYRSWKNSLSLTEHDQDNNLQDLLKDAETNYRHGFYSEALDKLHKIRSKTGSGALYTTATVYMANILGNQHRESEALDLLKPLQSKLPLEGKMLLLQLYYKTGHDAEAIALGHPLYQERAGFDVAIINAYCHARMGDARAAVGWLQCALRDGLPDFQRYLASPDFDSIRSDPAFQALLAS